MADRGVVLISGGAAGIGQAIAAAFLDAGAAVHVFDASREHTGEFLRKHPSATATQADVSKPDEVDKVFADLQDHCERVSGQVIAIDGYTEGLSNWLDK